MSDIFPEDPSSGEPGEGGPVKSFLDHLEDLRWVLLKSIAALGVGMITAGAGAKPILGMLEWPLNRAFQLSDIRDSTGNVLEANRFLISLHPADGFFVILKIMLFGGLFLAMPFIFYFLGNFIAPALKLKERRAIWPGVVAGAILFVGGVCLCYFVMLPPGLSVCYRLLLLIGVLPQWQLTLYLSFILWMMLGMGLSFELPIIILVLVKIGILDVQTLRSNRRMAILGCFVLAMFIAPTGEPISMTIMATPLYLLYEASIWIAWYWERQEKRLGKLNH